MRDVRERLRKNLSYYLTTKNITQKSLAESLNVSQAAVNNWIKGKNSPDIEIIAKLCEILNVSINDLLELPSNKAEVYLIQKYRSLDEYGKRNIDTLLENEYQRCQAVQQNDQNEIQMVKLDLIANGTISETQAISEQHLNDIRTGKYNKNDE